MKKVAFLIKKIALLPFRIDLKSFFILSFFYSPYFLAQIFGIIG